MPANWKRSSPSVRDDITGKRTRLAEVHAEQQAIVREAELADRRLSTLAADKAGWVERQGGARSQIATLDERITASQARPHGTGKRAAGFRRASAGP